MKLESMLKLNAMFPPSGKRQTLGYLEKLLIRPTSSLCSEFYPRNIKYMPVVKFFERLEFEQILLIFKIPFR